MNKREFIKSNGWLTGTMVALIAAGTGGKSVYAADAKPSKTYNVPDGIDKINIKSIKDGKIVLDYTISVSPGQTFTVTPLE